MGKIFTPEQVANNQIPEPGAHEAAGRFILDEFFIQDRVEEWHEFQHIDAAMVYGSTALGTAGLRSDVDVLAVYHPSREASAPHFINRVIREAEDKFNVPVELSFRAGSFDTSPTTIDALFIQHLQQIQDQDEPRWSHNWPVEGLYWQHPLIFTPEEVRGIAVKYIGAKANQFAKSIIEYRGSVDMRSFQRALELPKSIGRKVMAATSAAEGETQAMTSTGVMQHRLEVLHRNSRYLSLDKHGNPSHQYSLIQLDREYDQLLSSTIEESTSLGEYSKWIEANYPMACELAFSVSRMWQHIVANRIDQRTNHGSFDEDGQGQLELDIEVYDLRDDWVY
jgi:predicted nucleotidyltransferase